MDHLYEDLDTAIYHLCALVPGGGILDDGSLPPWGKSFTSPNQLFVPVYRIVKTFCGTVLLLYRLIL